MVSKAQVSFAKDSNKDGNGGTSLVPISSVGVKGTYCAFPFRFKFKDQNLWRFFYQKAGQNNAIPATCQIPKSTLHLIALSLSPMIQMWTRRVPWRGRVQLAKTTFDSNNCFFLYEKKEKQFLIMMLLFL